MAEKPRVKAPRQRAGSSSESDSRRRTLVIGAAVAGVAVGFVVVAVLLGVLGGGGPDEEALAAKFEAAGCTFQAVPALAGAHSVRQPGGTSPRWNTDPPTTGPHYGATAIFGAYEEEIELARVVHNLEHGGVYILYGEDVPEATVQELRDFYESHKTGTIMAPLDRLGADFALGAWVVEGDTGNGYLARCSEFDEDAASSFFETLQFRGPERLDPSELRPGH